MSVVFSMSCFQLNSRWQVQPVRKFNKDDFQIQWTLKRRQSCHIWTFAIMQGIRTPNQHCNTFWYIGNLVIIVSWLYLLLRPSCFCLFWINFALIFFCFTCWLCVGLRGLPKDLHSTLCLNASCVDTVPSTCFCCIFNLHMKKMKYRNFLSLGWSERWSIDKQNMKTNITQIYTWT